MTRSLWAAVAGALAFALTPGVALAAHGSPAVRSAGDGAHRHHHSPRLDGAARTGHVQVLAPGSGYAQAAGSPQVRWLQQGLVRLGFRPGPVDGRYGPLTAGAVERLQAASGLVIDGIAGPQTLAVLDRVRHAVLAPGAGYEQPDGSRGVRALQRRLRHAGFAPGPIDGRYGPLTMRAIQRYQRAHRLPATGMVGRRTFAALNAGGRHQPRPRRAPINPPAPRVANPPTPAPAQPDTSLPVGLVLLALAALGLAATADGYRRTRSRLAAGRREPGGSAPPRPENRTGWDSPPATPSRRGEPNKPAPMAGSRGGAR